MKILYCSGGGEPPFSANHSLAYALRSEGHDLRWVGPEYNGINHADVPIEDRPHPEYYTYDEVLALVAPWRPDAILVVEPHFFLQGDRPEGINCAYYLLDPHRGASSQLETIEEGNYTHLFNAQRYYAPIFDHMGIRQVTVPQAFDERRFTRGNFGKNPVCDISFVGQTGIAGMEYPHEDECGRYATSPPSNLPTDHTRFAFHEGCHMDYARRAEHLIRLCRDYDVRMYNNVYGDGFVKAIQKGWVGFNCSLQNDITLRPFEIMAAGRICVTDYIHGMSEYPYFDTDDVAWPLIAYRQYGFNPATANFVVDYYCVTDAIETALERSTVDVKGYTEGFNRVWGLHSWKSRARHIANALAIRNVYLDAIPMQG